MRNENESLLTAPKNQMQEKEWKGIFGSETCLVNQFLHNVMTPD
jgi:hypothetical protein